MRIGFALVVVTALGACGTDGGSGDPDAGDRVDAGPDGMVVDPPPAYGFRIETPEIEIPAGANNEVTYCYYFRTPNNVKMAIKRWESTMTPGSHHMIMFTTSRDLKTPGTLSNEDCRGFATASGGVFPVWTYAAQTPNNVIPLPEDDGNGLPLGMEVEANQAGYLQLHYLNATDAPLKVKVVLDAFAHEPDVAYTPTAAFVTYNGAIRIPPGAVGDVESQTCPTPANAKFWLMSTHTHKQAKRTVVKDGANVIFESTDWEHPMPQRFAPSFYTFSSNSLTWECTYDNTIPVDQGGNVNREITAGDSAKRDEMCMASGYFFPSNTPKFCYNNIPF